MQIIIAVTNDLQTDQRIQKVAGTFTENKHQVTLVGRKLANSTEITFTYPYKRFNLWFNKQFWFYANYNIRLFFYLSFKPFDLLLANDLDTLPASFLACRIRRKKLVYDSHEYFTEVPELIHANFQRKFWLKLEKWILPKLKTAITVSDSIAKAYQQKYNTPFQVIKNVPRLKILDSQIQKNEKPTIIYQGALNVGRGLELMIKTMTFLNDYQLLIAGTGDIDEDLKQLTDKLHLSGKVKFLGRLSADELATYTQKAYLGLSLEEDCGLNYRFALPNKLFDYIQARIPVLVSDLPEMKAVVEKYKVGAVLSERTPENLAKQIMEIYTKQIQNYFTAYLNNAAKELCWEREEELLLQLIENA